MPSHDRFLHKAQLLFLHNIHNPSRHVNLLHNRSGKLFGERLLRLRNHRILFASLSMTIVPFTLPLICSATSTVDSTSFDSSYFGQAA